MAFYTDGRNMVVKYVDNTTKNYTKMDFIYRIETRIVTILFCIVLYVIGIIGNSLIIWTFGRIKHLRIKQNIFVVFLSIVDLCIIGYLLPFNAYVMIVNDVIHSDILCKTNALTCHILFTCSVQFIMYIALCRYAKICHSSKFDRLFPINRILFLSLTSVISGMLFGLPLLSNDNFLTFDRTLHQCIFNRYGNRIYSFIYMGICLVLPISVTSFCYTKIYFHVKKSKLNLYQHWTNPLARKRLVHELILTRSQFAVFIAYLVLYMPFGITAMIGTRSSDFPDSFHAFAMYTCYLNSCINSILYGALNRNMRKAYRNSFPCLKRTDKHQSHSSSSEDKNSGSNINGHTNEILIRSSVTLISHSKIETTDI